MVVFAFARTKVTTKVSGLSRLEWLKIDRAISVTDHWPNRSMRPIPGYNLLIIVSMPGCVEFNN